MAITPEILIPRLGDILVEQGKITKEQLLQALEYQKQCRIQGKFPLIGQVIIDLGIIDQETLNQSITQQILILQTTLKQANETLEKKVQERTAELDIAYKKLSELSQLKVNFVSNISHELRTPLTHINGYVDLLLSDQETPLAPGHKTSVEVIKRASLRLQHLIDDLILFSTSETNKLSIVKETVDPTAILEDVFTRYTDIARNRQISLTKNISENIGVIQADKNKITWVLNQLADNAIKFTQAGGKVTLNLTATPDNIRFQVTDNGIGIDPTNYSEIFEPFHQLDGSSTRTQGGTGLGLALAKKIIEAHGSKIDLESVHNKGSSFSFFLTRF